MTNDAETALPQEKRSDIAGPETPLIRNEWYVAALSEEVTRQPIRRTILEHDLVLYRSVEGEAVVLQNRCAHRSYPLHLGTLNGDSIVCGYHGFEYAPDGHCAYAPSLGTSRPSVRIQSYPSREIGPFIWVWMGDPAKVDHTKLVDQPWYEEGKWRYQAGYIPVGGNYLGLHENLCDLSHLAFIHAFAKGSEHLARVRPKFEAFPDRVVSTLTFENFPVPPAIQRVMNFQQPVSETGGMFILTPAMHYGEARYVDSAQPPKVATRYIVHCMTPESPTSTHYFWAMSRDFGLDDAELDQIISEFAKTTFEEDAVALGEIQQLIEREKRPGFREQVIISDTGGILVMRMFARRAAAESEEAASSSSEPA